MGKRRRRAKQASVGGHPRPAAECGAPSERAIAWRTADSLSIRSFLGLELHEAPPDHSTVSRTRRLIDVETHEAVFTWMLQRLADAGLVKGKTVRPQASRPRRVLTSRGSIGSGRRRARTTIGHIRTRATACKKSSATRGITEISRWSISRPWVSGATFRNPIAGDAPGRRSWRHAPRCIAIGGAFVARAACACASARRCLPSRPAPSG